MAAPIIRWKNNPPPAEQVCDQIRTSSGVTFVKGGVNRVGSKARQAAQGMGARPAGMVLSAAAMAPSPAEARRNAIATSGALVLRALYDLVRDKAPLPSLYGLAEEIPDGTLRAVRDGLQFLCDAGQIRMAAVGGSADATAGRVIQIVATGWELRSANCPAWLKIPVPVEA